MDDKREETVDDDWPNNHYEFEYEAEDSDNGGRLYAPDKSTATDRIERVLQNNYDTVDRNAIVLTEIPMFD